MGSILTSITSLVVANSDSHYGFLY